MSKLVFTPIADDVTASQEVIVPPAVVQFLTSGDSVTIEASHDNVNFSPLISARELMRDLRMPGSFSSVLPIPPVPAGWHIRIACVGAVSGTVAIE